MLTQGNQKRYLLLNIFLVSISSYIQLKRVKKGKKGYELYEK